ncbi:PREDICTED: GLABROUS1 enhancer-binding protein-like isoform X2 [Camelina sativa]|uniref:GLABROUS1 enhancer-binding protein-like isoform X2 n=1 Tax=Camelina sativa TaxID=90675 RepID=A0ABM0W1L6_CAMSA|nr:PREDICTED: GLABROUS1 enhancer-binding protein-like isoform X2 [Camelina sativa]
MVNKKQRSSGDGGFSDTYTCDLELRIKNSNGFLPPSPPDSPVLKSTENLDSTPTAAAAAFDDSLTLSKSRRKRKATLSPSYAPSDSKRLWSKDDELVILKGIVDYRNKTGLDYRSDSAVFFEYIKDGIDGIVSKDQLMNKIRKLKSKFRNSSVKKPSFTNPQDSEIFDLSMAIWGKVKPGCVDDSAKRTRSKAFVEHEVVTNGGEPENDDGLAKGKSFDKNADKNTENENNGKRSEEDGAMTNGKPQYDNGAAKGGSCDDKLPSENVEKRVEKKKGEKGSEEEDGSADDELCALKDALEATMFQHIGNYAQKQMLQKLKTIKAKERKELSGEWKSLLAQEALLKSKKYSFTAKLANAAFHN